ncbi:MAG: glycosyltransferase family 39 protein [Patescibacteria group bacterium]
MFLNNKSEKKINYKAVIVAVFFIILFFVALYLRYKNIDYINFQNDEYYHLNTAVGFLKTGHFETWDFVEQRTLRPYPRARIFTIQVAASFKLLGINEFAGRLPALIWGLLLLPLIYFVSYKVSKSHLVSLIAVYTVSFDNMFIWSSRICRMYSMFAFLALLFSWLAYKALNTKNNYKYIYYLLAIITFYLAFITHAEVLVLAIGFLIYFILNFFKEFKYKVFTISAIIGGVVIAVYHFFIAKISYLNFIGWQAKPNWSYIAELFNQFKFEYLGWIVLLAGIIFLFTHKNNLRTYYYCLFSGPLVYFVWFADRYAAKKYILFLIPFIIIIFSDSLYRICSLCFKKQKYAQYILLIIILLFAGPYFSWPSVKENYFFQPARADWTYSNSQMHNYRDAYNYIADNNKNSDPVLIYSKRTYYLENKALNLVYFTENTTINDIQELVKKNKSGWIVWPQYKARAHLSAKVMKYIQKNFKKIEPISNDTHVIIFHWENN